MAEKRMFTNKIIDSDAFLDMPLSAQALYFHLNMRADDDGFVNNPKKITKYVNASDDDLKILLMKRFIIGFESGIIVIKHWRMHNTLKADRYHPTDYQEEFARLGIKKNKAYTDDPEKMYHPELPVPSADPASSGNEPEPDCFQDGSKSEPEIRKDKNRKDLGLDADKGSKGKRKKADAFFEFASGDDDLLKALRDFEKMRNEIEKPMSDRAKSMLLTKLQSFPRSEWIPILEQSIFHDWQGIFPLQDSSPRPARGQPQASKGGSAMDALRNLHAQYEDEE